MLYCEKVKYGKGETWEKNWKTRKEKDGKRERRKEHDVRYNLAGRRLGLHREVRRDVRVVWRGEDDENLLWQCRRSVLDGSGDESFTLRVHAGDVTAKNGRAVGVDVEDPGDVRSVEEGRVFRRDAGDEEAKLDSTDEGVGFVDVDGMDGADVHDGDRGELARRAKRTTKRRAKKRGEEEEEEDCDATTVSGRMNERGAYETHQ